MIDESDAANHVSATSATGEAFAAIAVGARAAINTIADDAPNSPQVIALSANVNVALTISPAAPGSNSATITAGQTATFHLQLTPGPGFAGSASFACTGAPSAATCTAPNVQLVGGTPVSYVVTVATTASTIFVPPLQTPRLPPFVWLQVLSLVACCGLIAPLLPASHRQPSNPMARLPPLAPTDCLSSLR